MSRRDLTVTGVVAVLCAALLVLFTDIEVGVVRWVNCGPLSAGGERNSELCR
jgi:hypothetical protein